MEESLYKEMILDLYRNPLNKKVLLEFDIKQKGINPSCGDEIEIMIQFDEQGRVKDIGHQGQGCAISQAAVSLLTEEVKGKTKKEIQEFSDTEMLNLLGIPISHTRMKCAMLGKNTLFKMVEK